ncbi:YxlC family protein [Jeotgalibacillus sp. R-1-5s-1]|uniref:YxlC family protein n=1 Tax=Jeotgalibacillus sp. R-1-5s-1 TaxID=2555897 RepID=UPI00106A6347|nr:YxlC family protein [Jeotgalibacillus sp. R-1-5s-1]TFD96553.1 hypothetical protein E2491_10500 [Jeotgalibacillus sp. R-1-5s-1]
MKRNRHDDIEEKLKEGLRDLDRVTAATPSMEEIHMMMTETRKRQRKELIWFILIALCLITVTLLVLINDPVLYAVGQLLFFIIAGISGMIYRRRNGVRQHE